MKRLISKYDEKNYTYMLKIINALGGRELNYWWLITNIEAYPIDSKISKLLSSSNHIIISNDELIDLLEKEDFQFIWATFYAISDKYTKERILNSKNFVCYEYLDFYISHKLADIQIDCVDSSYVQIISKDDKYINKFKDIFPLSQDKI